MRKADRELLFGEHNRAPELGSYVVLPLVKGKAQGLIAFSSEDGGHFQPHMDTLFLRHLALVLSHAIATLLGKWTPMSESVQPLPNGLQKPLERFYEYLRSEKGLVFILNVITNNSLKLWRSTC
ncbi:protein of unknown function DUF484 [Vibrio ponticus]|nr:protein of unknown function DUF484 [Vibrio ponticus]